MSSNLARILGALMSGLLFGAGLVMSGMTKPQKVLGFLDVFGNWDPSLLFVMAGAIAVHAVGHRLVRRRPAPLADTAFSLPGQTAIDKRVLVGAALFGVGWGLTGYCPGPAVVSLAAASTSVVVFMSFLLLGNRLGTQLEQKRR